MQCTPKYAANGHMFSLSTQNSNEINTIYETKSIGREIRCDRCGRLDRLRQGHQSVVRLVSIATGHSMQPLLAVANPIAIREAVEISRHTQTSIALPQKYAVGRP